MAAEAKEEDIIPEFRKMNQLWHTHINSIWPGAPDLAFFPSDYSIFIPIKPDDELDESIKSNAIKST